MKTVADLETRLLNELKQWFPKQCRDNFKDFHLYYQESKPGHDGAIIICSEQPANHEFKLAMPEHINKGQTIEQNFYRIRNTVLMKLPVLSY